MMPSVPQLAPGMINVDPDALAKLVANADLTGRTAPLSVTSALPADINPCRPAISISVRPGSAGR